MRLTGKGRALRTRAEKVPLAVVDRLGLELEELRDLQGTFTRVIAAAQAALADEPSAG